MRIAIVNDLLLAVEVLRRVVASAPGCEVAWVARDGEEAVRRCAVDVPDLILMDIVMPVMDGAEATRRIMAHTPTAILVVTSTVTGNFAKVFEAMGHGAFDAVQIPGISADGQLTGAALLLSKFAVAERQSAKSSASIHGRSMPLETPDSTAWAVPSGTADKLVPLLAIGASTGGPQALSTVLATLPAHLPVATVVIQHISADFAPGLAEWLSQQARRPVRIARVGDVPREGEILLAGTNDHLIMGIGGSLQYRPEPVEVPYRPSVDAFFASAATRWHTPGVGVLLTGMGSDGAKGLLQLKEKGWHTIAQDEATSVVYGMPQAAATLGAAHKILPLPQIGDAIADAVPWLAIH